MYRQYHTKMHEVIGILLISLSAFISIAAYGRFRYNNPQFTDPFQTKLGIWDFDGWSGLHVSMHMLLGYWYSGYWKLILGIGCMWELFECYVGTYKPDIMNGWGLRKSDDDSDNNNNNSVNSNEKVWWYGKWSDIVANVFGFALGSMCAYIITWFSS